MQKKNDHFLEKFVKKNYNNELEEVLEKKYFDENAKNFLLSILYKIEIAYKDYEQVKRKVEPKEEFIQRIIGIIRKDCEDIKLVKLHSEESKMLGNKTFLVEKQKKRIISYPIERKLLYCLAKIDKNSKIIKDDYYLIDETLSSLINTGNNIDMVESMRDFNGYSWTTISSEMESIAHNLIYQNIRMLVGYSFLDQWIQNREFIIDYLQSFQNRLEEKYEQQSDQLLENLKQLSVLLALKYEPKLKERIKKEKQEVEDKLEKVSNKESFVERMTKWKRKLTAEIKEMDETLNNPNRLQEEYEKRNEDLSLKEKIFSIRILSQMMAEERVGKIEQLEKLNDLLKPQNYVKYKEELEAKEVYLKLADIEELEKEIELKLAKFQKDFLACYAKRIQEIETKQDVINYLYEFRYYCLLPFNENLKIGEVNDIQKEVDTVGKLLIQKAHDLKVIELFSKEKEIDYQILKNIFKIRVIDLENIYLKVTSEKEQYYVQLFDENVFEEKIEMEEIETIHKKDLEIKFNKKVKIIN